MNRSRFWPRGAMVIGSGKTEQLGLSAIAAFAIVAIALILTTTHMALAMLAYLLLLVGLGFRKNRKVHTILMGTGIALDLAIVLTLQITRDAAGTAFAMSLGPWQMSHVISSTVAVVLYIPTVCLGISRLNGASGKSIRRCHIVFGIVAFAFRTVGLILMFSLLESLNI